MSDETKSLFAAAIQEHLELRRRNAVLEVEMPLANYIRTRESQSGERVEADAGSEEDDDTLATVSWPTSAA
jgi:hypothetical protein